MITFTVKDVEDALVVWILLGVDTVSPIAASIRDKDAEGGQRLRGQGLGRVDSSSVHLRS